MINSKQTLTVAVATGVMNAGGTETLIMEMLRHASSRIRYILLIHHEENEPIGTFDAEIRELNVEMRYIKSVGTLGVKGYIKAFGDFVTRLGTPIDIVHCHLNGVGGIISLAAKKAGIKHRICHCHADIHYRGGLIARLKSEIRLAGMKLMIDMHATDRWACSDTAWHRLFMPWRIKTVVNNMIDVSKYLSSFDKRFAAKERFGFVDKFVIGAVGRVAPIKNYEIIIKALSKIPDAEFVCFGRFSTDNRYCIKLMCLAKELNVSNRVHWMGNSNDIASDIHCIDVFLMPSFTEGFGMAAIEAQAAGIPTIVSTGVPNVIDTGLGLVKFVCPTDVEALVQSIKVAQKLKSPDSTAITNAFQKKSFDSVEAVKQIEDRYYKMYE